MLREYRAFEECRHATLMSLLGLVPVTWFIVVYQSSLSRTQMAALVYSAPVSLGFFDPTPWLNYLSIGAAHFLLVTAVAALAGRRCLRNSSMDKRRALQRMRFAIFAVYLALLVGSDALHVNLAHLSHERVFNPLRDSPHFAALFRFVPSAYVPTMRFDAFYAFSLYPIAFISVALWAMIAMTFSIAKDLFELKAAADGSDQDDRLRRLAEITDSLRSSVLVLSLVLITSTVATAAYLRVPLAVLDGPARLAFLGVSNAVTLTWGIVFSLTLLALTIYPYIVLQRQMRELADAAERTHRQPLILWLTENRQILLLSHNLKVIVSILLPALIGGLARLVNL